MNHVAEDILMHYGMKFRSGRYPWGSGDEPFQRSGDFLSRIEELKKKGWKETPENIESAFGMKTTDYRLAKQRANHERRQLEVDRAKSLSEDGLSPTEIGRIMGRPESTVRSYLNKGAEARMNRADVAADILRKELETKGMIDVGAGVERELGISPATMQEALGVLQAEGYNVYPIGIPQVTNPGKQSNTGVLTNPDVAYKDVYQNMGDIKNIGPEYYSTDGGATFNKIQYPSSIDGKRVKICYADEVGTDGHLGIEKDGTIELRRGVDDLDLGNSHYAQVRILVDDTHYLKGMALYSDDMPDGVDIVFNTNKKSGVPKEKVLKEIHEEDPSNPFGATIKANGQSYYTDKDGNQKLSPLNKIKEEGDWDTMSKNLSSQFLSKQPVQLIKKQLNLTYADKQDEFDEICALTNPTIKKKLLNDFADECDSSVVHLKAAALPRQSTKVILPVNAVKETEVYAPTYKNGEKVALIRYPHGGTFEIPELTVNNKNSVAKRILGNVADAIGINAKVAERLSGADFDGDQVVVIPTGGKVKIKTTNALKDLKDFDPKVEYSTEGKKGVKLMTKADTQKQMGVVSNLITDMTLKGAKESELARAVKHSMVVIDAAKHKLDYKQSEKDNGISELKKKYQVREDDDGEVKYGGASTLLSKRKQDVRIPERQGSGVVDKTTGKVTYKESGRTYVDKKTGETKLATQKVKLLSITDDVNTLSSGTAQEAAYSNYANKMKSLANQARKESATTGNLKYSASAKETYRAEVTALESKLDVAARNAPKERRANAVANSKVKAMVQDNPDMDKKEIKKATQRAIVDARASVGASGKDTRISITDKEWEAIQAGAVTENKLTQILRYADADTVRQKATPKSTSTLSSGKIERIRSMDASGYTNAEIADALGISPSAVSGYLK